MPAPDFVRRDADKHGLDYYPTPPWATEALLAHPAMKLGDSVLGIKRHLGNQSCLEPAAGGGHMVDVLEQHFGKVYAADIADPEGRGWGGNDFLDYQPAIKTLGDMAPIHNAGYLRHRYDWAITNPPFRLAYEFVWRMMATARNVAILARLQWLESKSRYEKLWCVRPPQLILVFSERVHMVAGRLANDTDSGSVMAMAWYVWSRELAEAMSEWGQHTILEWIPPATDGEQLGLTDEGDVVCDPFAGSGTTLKQALRLGRHAIGCDITLQYMGEGAGVATSPKPASKSIDNRQTCATITPCDKISTEGSGA